MKKIDTEFDFLTPEFLHLIVFRQKNLIIFPYVDLKHLHSLDIFALGHTPIDLESTALSNVKEIIELDATASYSQNRVFYFIYNISEAALKEVLQFRNIRCVVNTADNILGLIREVKDQSEFIFYNKKNKKFLNYDFSDIDLSLEEELIGDDTHILQDSLIQLKALATKIFLRVNESKSFHDLLSFSSYKMEHWNRILEFVRSYYSIHIPELNLNNEEMNLKAEKHSNLDFSLEYETIIQINSKLGREFVHLLHEYRSERVNASNLDLEQLYNPKSLYIYLRSHHWRDGIDPRFLKDWLSLKTSGSTLNDSDKEDFDFILNNLGIDESVLLENEENSKEQNGVKNNSRKKKKKCRKLNLEDGKKCSNSHFAQNKSELDDFELKKSKLNDDKKSKDELPSIRDFENFKAWVNRKLSDLEDFFSIK